MSHSVGSGSDNASSLKPLSFGPSLLYFGLPALAFVIGFHWLMPLFIDLGMLPYYAYLTGLTIPLALLLVASLIWLRLEGRPFTWSSIKARFRLEPMMGKDWLWSIGAVLVGSVVGFVLLSQLSGLLIKNGLMPVPANLPDFVSPQTITDPMVAYDTAVGGLRGNWLPVLAMTITLVFNILGEEFWWRGVVLPRQELALGRWTWVVHGLMWAVFHIFKWWDVLNLVPVCLSLAFVCTRRKSTTPGIVIHSLTNGVALIPLIAGALGLIG
ncbi:MAG: CPBP family intramembrane metalloprotease [Anaerolineae bacterium]|nr:CPBP family intramembrane metalloprotease [Anaerolineae bacterium]